ncbi:DUF4267 domain-containing protein [Amycolatopsis sp. cg5]|uniref:DUF4267 domain-containing protein n=1 Tax=Amycolatopsis sp. cg5 TaxID=3238802 RepID=UPI003526B7BC
MLTTAYVLTGLLAAFIAYIGVMYIWKPAAIAPGFGFRELPSRGDSYFHVKGVRDLGSAVIVVALWIYGDQHALGWLLLAIASIPLGDMLVVLRHKGKKAAAFGIHGATAALVVVTGILLLVG